MLVNCHQCLYDEYHKAQVFFGSLTWSMQQRTIISAQTPVVMLTATIDAIEGFLVQ